MKSKVLVVLFIGLIFAAALVHAERDDDDEDKPAAKPAAKVVKKAPAKKPAAKKVAKKPAAKKRAGGAKGKKGGAIYTADIPLEALSKLPVSPLAMDAAALKDDDSQFELFNAQARTIDSRNVRGLQKSLGKATKLMRKMRRDVEAEKVWTKNVYDIIQNYQYKYLKTIEDVRMREKKVAKMQKLVNTLKRSTLHAGVEQELSKASKALNELVQRSGKSGAAYTKITRRMQQLKNALSDVANPRQMHSETTARMKKILRNAIPPNSSDALRNLVPGAPAAGAKKAKKAKKSKKVVAKKGKKPAAGKKTAKKGKKPTAAKAKPAAKGKKGTKAVKKGKAAKKAGKGAKKAAKKPAGKTAAKPAAKKAKKF